MSNYSTAYIPPPTNQFTLNNDLAVAQEGYGYDMGLRFTLFGGRLTANTNYFFNQEDNQRVAAPTTASVNALLGRNAATDPGTGGRNTLGIPDIFGSDYRSAKTSGYELELVGKINRGWRVMFNAGTAEVFEFNRYPLARVLVPQNAETYRQVLEAAGGRLDTTQRPNGAPGLAVVNSAITAAIPSEQTNAVIDYNNVWANYAVVASDKPAQGQNRLTVNVFSDYTVQSGRLRGLRVGLGAQAPGRNYVGSRSADTIVDPANPTRAIDDPAVDFSTPVYVKRPTIVTATFGYMQDEAGTGTKTLRNGRIKRLTSSRNDGVMDRATVFVDGLNLPRMILPLRDGIAVVETDDTSVWHYRDHDGDGIGEEKTLLFRGKAGDGTRSVEHQDSGLDWNLDNRIYVSYGRERYRYTDGTWRAQPTHPIWTQWGVTHDDVGRVFFSDNSSPAMGFQLPRHYWSLIPKRSGEKPRSGEPISLGLAWDMSFLSAKNLCPVDDRGGPAPARKIFASICGQSVFRGTALPAEVRGDYFFCDPTIHVVRRAKLTDRNGRLMLSNPHGDEEFLLSPDILFRPVNTATGPDGCLTVVDMYRGIIQDAPWLSEGPRKFIRESGLATVNGHGRIWRIRHRDLAPTAAPRMSRETTAELLRHLENPNGWWRDTAQRQIILRSDRDTVAPALADMARFHENPLTRLHALWTLEGLSKIAAPLLVSALADRDPRVRAAAARLGEPLLERKDSAFLAALTAAAKTERVPEVAKQFILSLAFSPEHAAAVPTMDALIERHVAHEGVFLAGCTVFWKNPSPYLTRLQGGDALLAIKDPTQRAEVAARWTQGFAQWRRQIDLPADLLPDQRAHLTKGAETYFETCVSCHGPDGRGVAVPGNATALAPSLAGSARVKGPAAGLIPVLLNGLVGPIDGRAYEGAMMVPAASLGLTRDDRVAEVISFIRFAWGNEAPPVTKENVAAFRRMHATRSTPWTDSELKNLPPP